MASKEEILENLKKAVETFDVELAKKSAQDALDAGIDPAEAIESGLAKGMDTVGDLFDKGQLFLPQVMLAAEAMTEALKILEPAMAEKGESSWRGTIVMGTVEGDIHEIGRNVVAAMLRGAGYNIITVGRDCPADNFVEAAKEHNADIIGASALMTTTMPGQKDIVDAVKAEGLNVKTLFGGAPVTEEWVKEIGGDLYAANAAEAVKVVNKAMEGK